MASAEDFANTVAEAMDCRPRRHGREWRVYCPAHEGDGGDHSPSFAIWDKPDGSYACKCMAGCSKSAWSSALKSRGVKIERVQLTPEQKAEGKAKREQARIEKITAARDLYEASVPAQPGDAVETYLRSRGLAYIDGTVIRHVDDPMFPGSPAMLVPILDPPTIRDPLPTCTGVVTLSLTRDGAPRYDSHGHKLRSVHGVQRGNGVVYGDPRGDVLVVAEGVESMLSAMELLNIGLGIATLSASNMKPLRLPTWVKRVVIAQDDDEAGEKGADTLAKSLSKVVPWEIKVWHNHVSPDGMIGAADGWDANDELMRRKGLK